MRSRSPSALLLQTWRLASQAIGLRVAAKTPSPKEKAKTLQRAKNPEIVFRQD
jgi:hypothetical protein